MNDDSSRDIVGCPGRWFRSMMNPVVLLLVVTCVQAVTKLTDALCQQLTMRARGELVRSAAAVPPGVEVADRDRNGASWLARRTYRQEGGVCG